MADTTLAEKTDVAEFLARPIDAGRPDRPRPSEGRRHRALARLLLRRPRLRTGPAVRRPGGVLLGRRLPSPFRHQHLGEQGRAAAAAADDRPLPRGDPLSEPGGARRRAEAADRRRHSARRRERSRRQRSALPARPRRQRRSNSTATDRWRNGRGTPMARSAWSANASISRDCSARRHSRSTPACRQRLPARGGKSGGCRLYGADWQPTPRGFAPSRSSSPCPTRRSPSPCSPAISAPARPRCSTASSRRTTASATPSSSTSSARSASTTT